MSENEVTVNSARMSLKFIKKKHNLSALSKLLDEESAAALKFLIDTMNDEDVENKIRTSCAKDIINFNIQVSEQINKDELTRMIAQMKVEEMNNNTLPNIKDVTAEQEQKNSMSKLDFSNIKAV